MRKRTALLFCRFLVDCLCARGGMCEQAERNPGFSLGALLFLDGFLRLHASYAFFLATLWPPSATPEFHEHVLIMKEFCAFPPVVRQGNPFMLDSGCRSMHTPCARDALLSLLEFLESLCATLRIPLVVNRTQRPEPNECGRLPSLP